MKTFNLIALAAGSSFASLTTIAQERTPMDPQQMAQKQTDQIKKSVTGVTPDEESKILAVEQDFAKSAKEVRTSNADDREAMRAKMKPLKEDRDAKIKGILTADQYAEYQKMEESHQQWGGKKGVTSN